MTTAPIQIPGAIRLTGMMIITFTFLLSNVTVLMKRLPSGVMTAVGIHQAVPPLPTERMIVRHPGLPRTDHTPHQGAVRLHVHPEVPEATHPAAPTRLPLQVVAEVLEEVAEVQAAAVVADANSTTNDKQHEKTLSSDYSPGPGIGNAGPVHR